MLADSWLPSIPKPVTYAPTVSMSYTRTTHSIMGSAETGAVHETSTPVVVGVVIIPVGGPGVCGWQTAETMPLQSLVPACPFEARILNSNSQPSSTQLVSY